MNTQRQRREVFKEIYGVELFHEVLEQFETDYNSHKNKGLKYIQELYKHYSYAIFFMYSPSSIRNNLVKFKNLIKKHGGKYQANALESFTVEAIYTPIKRRDEEVHKEQKAKVQSGENTKIDPSEVVEQIEALKKELDTKSYSLGRNQKEEQVRAYRIVAMLGLATGRRFTELMKTLTISKRGTKLTFDGLLKGNNEAIEGNIIGLTYKEVKAYLEELRTFAKTEKMTESEVNTKYAKVFNNAMARLVKEGLINDFKEEKNKYMDKYITSGRERGDTKKIRTYPSVKTMRHNYSIAGSQLFKREGENPIDTITRILGHKEIFASALSYT